jgi:hypothetical protein
VRILEAIVANHAASHAAIRLKAGLPPARFEFVDTIEEQRRERARRAAEACAYCRHGARTVEAIRIHNLRVAEFGERTYTLAQGDRRA